MSTQNLTNYFNEIYNNTYKNTLKYIVCKCSDLEDVNDILQDIYLELLKYLKKIKCMRLAT